MEFKFDNFDTELLLKAYENAEYVNKTDELIINVSSDYSFQIYGSQTTDSDTLKEILFNVNKFNNIVQKLCKHTYEHRKSNIRNYIVYLSWIEIESGKVVMGYWGEYVNIELRAIFVKKDDAWKEEKIYYQF